MSGAVLVERPEVLADEPVGFKVTGCTPGETVTVQASWAIGDEPARSEGRYIAPASGIVEPARLASVGGTYTGTDPYGLWWSVGPELARGSVDSLEEWTVSLLASGSDWQSAGSLVRRKVGRAVRQLAVASGRLRGIAFVPEGSGPFPSVLLFSGSGGGLGSVQCSAALLAGQGFATFALAYFNYPELPSQLADIPLEYFAEGMDWLRASAPAAGGRVGVMGASRGGELALLLGATFPEVVAAVVAMVPSGVVWCGLSDDPGQVPVAWTLGGIPVPHLPEGLGPKTSVTAPDGSIVLTPSFEARLAELSAEAIAAATIPVERTAAPILLISGDDDALWPSGKLAEIAVERGQKEGARYPLVHLRYPDSGHSFPGPAGFPVASTQVHSLTGEFLALGGMPAGNAQARIASWQEILRFFASNLPTGKESQ